MFFEILNLVVNTKTTRLTGYSVRADRYDPSIQASLQAANKALGHTGSVLRSNTDLHHGQRNGDSPMLHVLMFV
jgi:hypothetical protein